MASRAFGYDLLGEAALTKSVDLVKRLRMKEPISIHAAKTHLSRLIARAEAGEEIVIARGRKPVAKLVPIAPKAKRVFGALKGKVSIGPEFFEPLPPEELDTWDQGRPDL